MATPADRDPQLTLRRAQPADQAFLNEVLWMAHTWRASPQHPPMPDPLPEPISRYADGFGRPGDVGVVALSGAVEAGAAWWRHRTAADPGYGYVADDTPELTVGVRPGHRRRGIAAAMVSWLVNEARAQGLPALSLSVEADNPAVVLYRRAGFAVVAEADDARTLVLDMARSRTGRLPTDEPRPTTPTAAPSARKGPCD